MIAVEKQSGFSLVELLVAITVMLIIMAATLGAFNDALRANEAVTLYADMDQNLRAGANLMIRDLMQAGQGIPTGGIPVPNGAGVLLLNRPSPPLAAYTFALGATTLSAITTGNGLGPVSNGPATDMVTIMYADSTLVINQLPLQAVNANGSDMTVNAATPIAGVQNALQAGDLILLSNALGNALQTITRVNGTQTVFFDPNDSFQFNQRGAPAGSVMCISNVGTNTNPLNCAANNGGFPPTTATRVWIISYYLDTNTDPLMPRLVRQVNFNPGRPVALVIDNMQLSYDLVDGVTNPVNVATPVAPNSENQIRKANLFFSARSSAAYSRTRSFFRTSLATQVSLRSLSFVDRYL
ncbi:MAG: prepilin-type N-terminal cleavage/methylation domain-containing protein [Acidobacteria bacterium]|nr:prepilin-type N-terminal cleavage/methylation domain-containing protein [Acidobacteriota bacterium]MBI3662562.1 prepilin-type N-terminal cleavage/methylation domain-containing protein [Acidobacteriota bacterium]